MPKRYKHTSFWICAALAVAGVAGALPRILAPNVDLQAAGFRGLGIALIFGLVAFFLARRNLKADAACDAYEREQLETQRLLREKLQAEQEEKKQRQAAWNAAHGTITTRLAGVTFDNEDGSSRQRALQGALADECTGDVELELYDWKGQDAVRVLYDGVCVGNIPRDRVAEVAAVMDRITAGSLSVNRFTPEDEDDETSRRGGVIYRADLTIVYSR